MKFEIWNQKVEKKGKTKTKNYVGWKKKKREHSVSVRVWWFLIIETTLPKTRQDKTRR